MTGCPVCNYTRIKPYYSCQDMVIYRCLVCGMMFQDPASSPFTDAGLIEKIYGEYIFEFSSHLSLNRDRLERIKKYLKRPLSELKILEIGPGTGLLGSLLLEQGADYQGLEPSRTCYEYIANKFPPVAACVLNRFYEDGIFQDNYFDLIIMVDTLEHIPYPVNFLGRTMKHLKDNGLFYLEIPNESLLACKARLRKEFKMYYGYPTNPEHANLFTKTTLKKALNVAGLKGDRLFQITVWGDRQRLKIALGKRNNLLVRLACNFFRLTKIDLLLQQGIIVSVSHK